MVGLYTDDRLFRSHIVMAQHGFGRGEYKYFTYPLPDMVSALRTAHQQNNDRFRKFDARRAVCSTSHRGKNARLDANRPFERLEDARGELARKGLTHRRMSNDSPKIQRSCQRVDEQVGVGIPRQLSGRDGLLNQV
jgi:hypothetical protein